MKKQLSIILLAALTAASCTKLKENVYDTVTSENFYQTEQQVLSAVGPAYSNLRTLPCPEGIWAMNEFCTDEIVLPTRGANWYNGGQFQRMQKHTWTPTETFFNNAWVLLYADINNCNRLMYQFGQLPAPSDAVKYITKELRGLRAFNYYYALDLFGNVPWTVNYDVPKGYAPATLSRVQIYDSLEQELVAIAPQLNGNMDITTYGRFHKWAAFATLAKLYLNAQVYTGTPQWDKCIAACDSIINSGKFTLSSDFYANFATQNDNSKENIFVIPFDSKLPVDWGSDGITARMLQFPYWTLYGSGGQAYNMTQTCWNGFCAVPSFYNSYNASDLRRNGWATGLQYTKSGNPIYLDGTTTQLNYTVPIGALEAAADNQGARWVKYDYTGVTNYNMDNDFVVFRYADILLMKAEALMRKNGGTATADAVNLVNMVRARAFTTPAPYTAGTLTLTALLAERGWELYGEGWRRNDLIRFDKFDNGTWEYKTTATPTKNAIFPIPQQQLGANQNLKQNPGY